LSAGCLTLWVEEKRGRRCCLPGSQTGFGLG